MSRKKARLEKIIEILYPSFPSADRPDIAAEIMTHISANTLRSLLIGAYTFRLLMKAPLYVHNNYTNRKSDLLACSDLMSLPDPTDQGWRVIKAGLAPYSDSLFWLVAEAFHKYPRCWLPIKKWFGSRFEWAGLAITSAMLVLSNTTDVPSIMRGSIMRDSLIVIMKNVLTYLLYAIVDFPTELEPIVRELCDRHRLETPPTSRDKNYGRFCKLVSSDYLCWASFFNEKALASTLLGAISAQYSASDEAPAAAIPVNFLTGRNYVFDMMRKQADTDVIATDRYKHADKALTELQDPSITMNPPPLVFDQPSRVLSSSGAPSTYDDAPEQPGSQLGSQRLGYQDIHDQREATLSLETATYSIFVPAWVCLLPRTMWSLRPSRLPISHTARQSLPCRML
ncbi:hypothetical protein Aduo_012586 [Ancylostoma duodenale]